MIKSVSSGYCIIFTIGILILSVNSITQDAESVDLSDIEVLVTHKPTECQLKTSADDVVYLHYTSFFQDGTQFDSSVERGEPLYVPLGKGKLLPGVEKGLIGMCMGEKRRIVVPPHLGYGSKNTTTKHGVKIPADSVLSFEVELLLFNNAKQIEESFIKMDANDDGALERDEVSVVLSVLKEAPKNLIPKSFVGINLDNLMEELFSVVDSDKNGKLEYAEFLKLIRMDMSTEDTPSKKDEL